MKQHWWKLLAVLLLLYTIIGGFLMPVPELPILNESIRNTYFHIPLWFGMIVICLVSVIGSIRYLANAKLKDDWLAVESANVGILLGVLGYLTGMIWAKVTWGAWWVSDPRLNGAAITLLIYLAYMVLRGSLDEETKRARISAVYNIFAYSLLIVLLIILPRMTDSLHPGAGGNPGFSNYDLDNMMRMVFYPAIIGWILLGVWLMQLRLRIRRAMDHLQKNRI